MADSTKSYNYRDIKRVVENVKKELFNDLATKLRKNLDKYEADEFVDIIIDRLNSGAYKLKKSMFDEVLGNFIPSNKNKIIAEIKDWMDEIRSADDNSGTSSFPNVQGHPDFEDDDEESPKVALSEETPAEEDHCTDETVDILEEEPADELIDGSPELIRKAFAMDDQSALAPDGTARISFRLTAPPVGDVFVMTGKTTFECVEEDGVYSVDIVPGAGENRVRVMIFDNDGLYDTVNVELIRGIAGNADFDL